MRQIVTASVATQKEPIVDLAAPSLLQFRISARMQILQQVMARAVALSARTYVAGAQVLSPLALTDVSPNTMSTPENERTRRANAALQNVVNHAS